MMKDDGLGVYLTGPNYHPEEQESMQYIEEFLKKSKFRTVSSATQGFQYELIKLIHDQKNIAEITYSSACILAFALDYFQLISSDLCIGFINGRVPDEATIIKLGIAFGSGIPVILYKIDPRILFSSGINSMISGLSGDFKTISQLGKLPSEIRKKVKNQPSITLSERIKHLPPYNRLLFTLGNEIQNYLNQQPMRLPNTITWLYLEEMVIFFTKQEQYQRILCTNLIMDTVTQSQDKIRIMRGKVYCSGALFCPEEVRDMKNIATNLEKAEYPTFLPQRDGGEPFVVGSLENPLAGSLISKPLTHLIDKILFSVDIYEIFQCPYFVINLNGRVPDDGAMVELGVAFAMGKPIVLFHNDIRTFSHGKIHPTITAVAYGAMPVTTYSLIPFAFERILGFVELFGKNSFSLYISERMKKVLKYGEKWIHRLQSKKIPPNQWENWNH